MKYKPKKLLSQHFTPPALVTELVAQANIKPGMKVLEPSCGDGEFVLALSKQPGIEVTAIDIDAEAIMEMKQRLKGLI